MATTTSTPVVSGRTGLDRMTRRSRRMLGYAVLLFFAFLYLMPFLLAVSASFKTRAEVASNPLGLIPDEATLQAWQVVANSAFPLWLRNSIIVTLSSRSVGCSSTPSPATPSRGSTSRVARSSSPIVATLAVPGIVLAVPRFLVLRQLGMLNSFSGLILPLAVDAFGIFLMKQFFESIPKEIEEAAKVDGASVFTTWWRDRAADGGAGADRADDPVLPGVLERVPAPADRRADQQRECGRCRWG
jgi:multiple sugar transport system permease protein